jgi:ABC-2 type transport system ATP-binding protein
MLELDGLTRRFGDVVALDDLSFTVAPGELRGFLGPNGAGKTTAMRIVMGITSPDAGVVRFDGRELTREDRRGFGYMPEERGLYPRMTVRDQLVYLARLHDVPPVTARERADRWIARVGLGDRATDLISDLSLGNQQRVQLAAALVHAPRLLVLDEPFSGLDPLAVDVLSEVLRELASSGVGVVFSSHQLDLVEHLCETVAIVDAGRLVLEGQVTDLKRRGRDRLRIGVDTDTAWWEGIAGTEVLERRGAVVTLALDADVASAPVVAEAQRAGALTHLSVDEPSLSELFRDAVRRSREVPA